MVSTRVLLRRVRRSVLRRRRLLAALCAMVAVVAGLRAASAPPPPTVLVLTAARDLPAGTVLADGDLRKVPLPPPAVPNGTLTASEALGRTTAAPLRAGEPLTDVRIVRASLVDGYPGSVAVPVRLGDADAVRLLRVGDRIDLLGADPSSGQVETLVHDASVVALPRAGTAGSGTTGVTSGDGALVVVAVPPQAAPRLAGAAASSFVSFVITGA